MGLMLGAAGFLAGFWGVARLHKQTLKQAVAPILPAAAPSSPASAISTLDEKLSESPVLARLFSVNSGDPVPGVPEEITPVAIEHTIILPGNRFEPTAAAPSGSSGGGFGSASYGGGIGGSGTGGGKGLR